MNLSPLFHNCPPEGELLPQEQAAFALLRTLDIPYDRVSGDPADDMEKCRAVEQVLGSPICKNLFLCNRQKTPLLRPGGQALGAAALHPRLRHHPGPHERHRAPGPSSHRPPGL